MKRLPSLTPWGLRLATMPPGCDDKAMRLWSLHPKYLDSRQHLRAGETKSLFGIDAGRIEIPGDIIGLLDEPLQAEET